MSVFADPAARSDRAPSVQNHRYKLLNPETGKSERWSRVTTFAKTLAETSALGAWEIRMVIKGLSMRPDLMAGAEGWDVKEHKAAFAGVASRAKEGAGAFLGAERGTRIHDLTETLDRGHDLPEGLSDPERDGVAAYGRAVSEAKLGVLPEYIERYVAIPRFKVCGKLDRIYDTANVDAIGEALAIGDVKTAANLDYGWLEIMIQLGLYSMATHFWDERVDDWVEMPAGLSRSTAVVAHVPWDAGYCDMYAVDLTYAAEAAELCERVRAFRSRKDFATPVWRGSAHVTAHDRWARAIRKATTIGELSEIWREASAAGEWSVELMALGKARQAEFSPFG